MTALVAPIVVGIDGSSESHAALSWVLPEAARRHAPVRLVNAYGSDLLSEGVMTYAAVPSRGRNLSAHGPSEWWTRLRGSPPSMHLT